jgi:hypothetical protein
VGDPLPFPSWYDPFGYGSSYYGTPYEAYRYAYGGLSFEVRPSDTEVFIDGAYAGFASNYTPYSAPLTLLAGTHRVELRAVGCQPAWFDLTVSAGRVIPYRGSLSCGR